MLPVVETEAERPEWLKFKGRWGAYLDFYIQVLGLRFWQQGPFGPPWGDGEQPSRRWENPAGWATELPQYPQPFWTSFFKIAGDWFNQAFFSVFSPADLHVYDSSGRHVGLNEQGELETEIPGAIYINPEGTDYKTIIIPNADVSQGYTLIVKGTGKGEMEIKAQVPDAANRLKPYLEYTDVPVSAKTLARVNIVPGLIEAAPRAMAAEVESVSIRDTTTRLELDSDGDGTPDFESAPGNFERQKVLPPVVKARVDIEPDVVNLAEVTDEKFITAYIELPREYNPKSIDLNSVRLAKDITALPRLVDIVDHDQNGIYELMVRFERRQVVEYLVENNLIGEEVPLPLAGFVDGRPFEGAGTINVFRGPSGQIKKD